MTEKDDNGALTEVWVFDEVVKPIRRNIASVGLAREEMDLNPISFDEMRRGCFDPVARLEDMDLNHVEASLCFPQMIRFCGQEFSETKDRELGLACIRAYNDWMLEEWCATDPARLIPLGVVPLWDGKLAAAEVRRNAARGFRAVSLQRESVAARLPEYPLRILGSILRGLRRDRDHHLHAHRLVVEDGDGLSRRATRRWASACRPTTRSRR